MADAKSRKSKKKSKTGTRSEDTFEGYGSNKSVEIKDGVLTIEVLESAVKRIREEGMRPYIPLISNEWFNRLEYMIEQGFLKYKKYAIYEEIWIQFKWMEFKKKYPEIAEAYELNEE